MAVVDTNIYSLVSQARLNKSSLSQNSAKDNAAASVIAHRWFQMARRQFAAMLMGLLALCCITAPALADTAVASITAGTSPNAVAVNPVSNKIYVANYSSNNVTVIKAI